MKAFVTSLVILIVVAVAAAYALRSVDMSAERVYSSDQGSVRLSP